VDNLFPDNNFWFSLLV